MSLAGSGVQPDPSSGSGKPALVRRSVVTVRMASGEKEIRHRGELLGFCEQLGEQRSGILEISDEHLVLELPHGDEASGLGKEGKGVRLEWGPLDIAAIQTSSSSVQIVPRSGGLVHFRFAEDSPKRWDELLQTFVKAGYRRAGLGEIVEFQPRIRTGREFAQAGGNRRNRSNWPALPDPSAKRESGPSRQVGVDGGETDRSDIGSGGVDRRRLRSGDGGIGWYWAFRALLKALLLLRVRTDVSGLRNIPASGPFILVANHQSVLDPILVQTTCPRPLHTFTKSTQFSGAFFRWVLARVYGIPTRRYRIDPQVVRVALRRLDEGKGVGIYPEGERSWDGALQPFRQGTIRLLLKAGVPVVPCGIDGSYDVWPRWSRRIRRFRVRIRFGEAIHWPALNDREQREVAAPEAARRLRAALVELGAWSRESEAGG